MKRSTWPIEIALWLAAWGAVLSCASGAEVQPQRDLKRLQQLDGLLSDVEQARRKVAVPRLVLPGPAGAEETKRLTVPEYEARFWQIVETLKERNTLQQTAKSHPGVQWHQLQPRRQTGYGGVFGEIEDGLAGPTRFRGERFDVWVHEDTHILNSQISRRQMAFVLPGRLAIVVPMTGLRVRDVGGAVPVQYRNTWVYRLYFQGQPVSGKRIVSSDGRGWQGVNSILENPALVPFDELSAFTCELAAEWERGRDTTETLYAADWLKYYCGRLALHLRDRNYSHWRTLHQFAQLAEENIEQIRGAQ